MPLHKESHPVPQDISLNNFAVIAVLINYIWPEFHDKKNK